MRWKEVDSQVCSIARTLAIFGDKWTLLIIRDAFRRVRRFSDFQKSLGIPKHRLSDRLNKLVDTGVLKKVLYDENRSRYEYRLTPKGLDLFPVLMTFVQWGDRWATDQDGSPVVFRHLTCGEVSQPKYVCDQCDEPVDARNFQPEVGSGIAKKISRGEMSTDDQGRLNEIIY